MDGNLSIVQKAPGERVTADSPGRGVISMSEVLSALSYALDITEGQPEGHASRTCLIGMRLGAELGLSPEARSDLFYALLLKDLGCSSNAARTCELFAADDFEVKRTWKTANWPDPLQALLHVVRNAGVDESPLARAKHILAFASAGPVGTEMVQTRCERGADIAAMIGLSAATADAIRALDEHWDGKGKPYGLAGGQIPLLARIACLAQTVEVYHAAWGRDRALSMARQRSGSWFDPQLVRALETVGTGDALWADLRSDNPRLRVSAVEPPDLAMTADDARLDRIAEAFARVIDAKSPYTFRHSEGVAAAADGIASVLGFTGPERRDLRRAALLHDIGKLGVSNRILDKPGRLTPEEMASVRAHAEHTERILSRVAELRGIASVAAAHHERMDGRGYHRGIRAGGLPVAARLLAVADVFDALSAERPYRKALPIEQVMEIIQRDAGPALCPESVEALRQWLARGGMDRFASAG